MSREPSSDGSRAKLDAVLADYMQRVDRGETLDVESLVRRHPELASELRERCCWHGQDMAV